MLQNTINNKYNDKNEREVIKNSNNIIYKFGIILVILNDKTIFKDYFIMEGISIG